MQILEAIYQFEGLLGDYQIQRLFFTGKTQMTVRTKLLYQNGYLARPDRKRRASLPCMVYWLGKRGAEYLAGLSGKEVGSFKWRSQPRWSLIPHDLLLNDFRLDVIDACKNSGTLELEEWVTSSEFWAFPDRVAFINGHGNQDKRYIRPDGYCVIVNRTSHYRSRLLLELDRGSESLTRIGNEKILPGIAYLRSEAYQKRTGGFATGRWLFVAGSERRMRNMKRYTETVAGKHATVFYFTILDRVNAQTVLTAPIWYQGGETHPTSLFKP